LPIRKLLLSLTGTEIGEAALVCALMIARDWNAHLCVLHVRVDSREVAPLAGEGLSGAMIEDMMRATEAESAQRYRAAQALFHRVTAEQGVPVRAPRPGADGPTASLETVTGREEDLVVQFARLADLTVVPHPGSEDGASASDSLHAVLFDSGRPVLIAPPVVPETIGRRCCVAWNGTAESAAAVQAILPWLQRAEAVQVLAAEGYQRRGPSAESLLPYLALHGVTARVARFRPVERSVGAGLLMAAREFGADLLGMGAYSHSRLRQLILGGVTRHVLERAALPVLMCR